MKIYDYVWGEFEISEKFVKILPCLKSLKNIRQLGIANRNPKYLGGNHSRYEHSIGTFIVANFLLKNCEKKFGDYFTITEFEKDIFLLSALMHDLGHKCFSHAIESVTGIAHEIQTIDEIKKIEDVIDEIFAKDTTKHIIMFLENCYKLKKKDCINTTLENDVNLNYILYDLLSGAIDVDRIDYIARDYLYIFGEHKKFACIFRYINIDLVNGKPKVVFDEKAVPIIEKYLLTRANNYSRIYYESKNIILDEYIIKFIRNNYTLNSIKYLEENEVDKVIYNNGPYSCEETRRYAEIITDVYTIDNLLFKVFNNKQDLNIFKQKLSTIVDFTSLYFYTEVYRKICIYDSRKNKIYIRKNEEVLCFSQVSKIIKDNITEEKNMVILDVHLMKKWLKINHDEKEVENIVDKTIKLFSTSIYEIEKKYIITKYVFGKLAKDFYLATKIFNNDVYFTYENKPTGVTLRKRNNNEYTIKTPITDCSSLSKRKEHTFINITEDKFIEISRKILQNNTIELTQDITILTSRESIIKEFKNSLIEMSLDHSIYTSENKEEEDFQLEIELKSGNAIDLWFFTKELNTKFNLTECNTSKYTRGKEKLK